MDTEVEISRFQDDDRQGVIDVILPIQREEFGIAITAEGQPDLHDIPGFYQTGVGDFWVAKKDGVVIGTIGSKDIGNAQIALRKMFMAGPYRGREFGVAAALLKTLLTVARERATADVFLGTMDRFLAAHRFYEKNGFAEVAKNALPVRFPLMAVDTRFYLLRLGERKCCADAPASSQAVIPAHAGNQ